MSEGAHTRGRERPILFSAPMVRALLSGTKTQTRRLLGQFDVFRRDDGSEAPVSCLHIEGETLPRVTIGNVVTLKMLKAAVGDRLWVREAHYLTDDGHFERAVYAADEEAVREHNKTMERLAGRISENVWRRHVKLRPSIHMPRWASRLTLTVTDVRVQRLQEISGNDAQAEGISIGGPDVEMYRREAERNHEAARRWNAYRIRQYRDVWEAINGAGSWDANPWVAAYTFTVEQRNIDAALSLASGEAVDG